MTCHVARLWRSGARRLICPVIQYGGAKTVMPSSATGPEHHRQQPFADHEPRGGAERDALVDVPFPESEPGEARMVIVDARDDGGEPFRVLLPEHGHPLGDQSPALEALARVTGTRPAAA